MNPNLILLYVEDEKNIREEMVEILSLDFDTIHIAKNGQEGLDMFQDYHPDLVISDIQMPLMDGLSMSQKILALDDKAKIILTTAFNEEGYLKKSKDIGIVSYVKKPVNISELFETIEAVFSANNP